MLSQEALTAALSRALEARAETVGAKRLRWTIVEALAVDKRAVDKWFYGEAPIGAANLYALFRLLGPEFKNEIESEDGWITARAGDATVEAARELNCLRRFRSQIKGLVADTEAPEDAAA